MAKHGNTISSQILEKLRKDILSGKYQAGTFLPSERELAELYDVSKSTMHNVLAMLHDCGLVCINPGRGILVNSSASERKRLKRFFFRTSEYGWFNASRVSSLMLSGICKGAQKANAEVLMSFSDSESLTDLIISEYSAGRIQGIIYGECSRLYDSLILPLEKAGVPYAIGNLENDYPAVAVQMDYRDIARRAVKHLTALGHKKIGIVNWNTVSSSTHFIYRELLAGFKGALAEESLPCDERFIFESAYTSDSEKADAEERLMKYFTMRDSPTAVFAARNYIAAHCFNACEKLSLKIPDDVSVISYDDLTWDMAGHKALTTFREPSLEMGELAVGLLNSWIDSGMRPEKLILKAEIVTRGSTSAPREIN